MLDEIICYNNYHNGDLHVSRTLIRFVIENIPARQYTYYHNNSFKVLQDIPQLKQKKYNLPEEFNYRGWVLENNILFLNSWYNAYNQQEFKGCSIQTLFNIFRRGLKETINFDLPGEPINYIPEIDGFCYTHEPITNWLNTNDYEMLLKNKILISNCDVLSGQSENFDFNLIISYLADTFPSIVFIVTNINGEKLNKHNLYYFQDIIKVDGCNLNEIALLSNFTPIIVGRSSGPDTFALLKRNLFDEKKVFICFSHETFGVLGENIKARFVSSQNYSIGSVTAVIEKEIRRRYGL